MAQKQTSYDLETGISGAKLVRLTYAFYMMALNQKIATDPDLAAKFQAAVTERDERVLDARNASVTDLIQGSLREMTMFEAMQADPDAGLNLLDYLVGIMHRVVPQEQLRSWNTENPRGAAETLRRQRFHNLAALYSTGPNPAS